MVTSHNLIESSPKILGGVKVVRGTRIPVTLLMKLIKVGYPNNVISYEYPSLTTEKIIAFRKLIEEGNLVSQAK